MYLVTNIKLGIDENPESLKHKISKKIGVPPSDFTFSIYKESIDARFNSIVFNYQFLVSVKSNKKLHTRKDVEEYNPPVFEFHTGTEALKSRPIVVGFGPAGMFSAYILARNGFKPIVIERGADIDSRNIDIDTFWETGKLNIESNVQFGEGGAGTYSDGKLTSRSKNPINHLVLELFVNFGAPKDILYMQYPHIGTDILRSVVKNIRNEITSLGGEIFFNTKMTNLEINDGKISGIETNRGVFKTNNVILSIGHSARDTFRMLHDAGISMESKPFAVGFRVEHPQVIINKAQFKNYHESNRLPVANYKLAYKHIEGSFQRGVYSFCMCPGGYVVNASSEEGKLVVNGMSYRARDKDNANAAIITSVDEKDFGVGILAGLEFQEHIEKKAFDLFGGYKAPISLLGDFLKSTKSTQLGSVIPTVQPGYEFADLSDIYPENITKAIQSSFVDFERKIKGFSMYDAILTGVETRSSSPIRINRVDMESNIKGLYPAGEGAGYAGGIVSSAIDGIKAAQVIISKYASIV